MLYGVFMTAFDLKEWMEANDKRVIDISAFTGLDPATIKRFLNGSRPHYSTISGIKRYIDSVSNTKPEAKKATG